MHGTALHTAGLGPFEAFLVVLVAVIGALLIHVISRGAGTGPCALVKDFL
jgi:hypothetical protein